ncbi:FkbM family methyltransferase [Wenzhouxiangella sp. EGI_FJ10305]|uniref:FkbM family methyltransferase n=1 Tax=Wenzhouxiangella sp. EGI_FJ10305 TaxID=3243768 RepID=UPI0035E276A0
MISNLKRMITNRLLWNCKNQGDFAHRATALCKLKKRSTRVSWDEEKSLFLVWSSTVPPIYVARRNRVKEKYLRDVDRPREIFEKYLLPQVPFQKDDIIIDVGANIGELALHLARTFDVRAICLEPDPVEFACLRANMQDPKATLINGALWNTKTRLEFSMSNDSGDSSLLPSNDRSPRMEIETSTLDDIGHDLGLLIPNSTVKLLKLEAEGAEPEILEGGASLLRNVQFVSADLGPERGTDKQHTICECVNLLTQTGFKLAGVNFRTHVYLFRNESLVPTE